MTTPGPAYRYTATVQRVIDGDTIIVDIDLGFHVQLRGQSVRLRGCNARELAGPGGAEARDHLMSLLPAGTQVTISTVKVDKYGGRYDASVLLSDSTDLVTVLISTGWAAAWDGSGVKAVPVWPREPSPA